MANKTTNKGTNYEEWLRDQKDVSRRRHIDKSGEQAREAITAKGGPIANVVNRQPSIMQQHLRNTQPGRPGNPGGQGANRVSREGLEEFQAERLKRLVDPDLRAENITGQFQQADRDKHADTVRRINMLDLQQENFPEFGGAGDSMVQRYLTGWPGRVQPQQGRDLKGESLEDIAKKVRPPDYPQVRRHGFR